MFVKHEHHLRHALRTLHEIRQTECAGYGRLRAVYFARPLRGEGWGGTVPHSSWRVLYRLTRVLNARSAIFLKSSSVLSWYQFSAQQREPDRRRSPRPACRTSVVRRWWKPPPRWGTGRSYLSKKKSGFPPHRGRSHVCTAVRRSVVRRTQRPPPAPPAGCAQGPLLGKIRAWNISISISDGITNSPLLSCE